MSKPPSTTHEKAVQKPLEEMGTKITQTPSVKQPDCVIRKGNNEKVIASARAVAISNNISIQPESSVPSPLTVVACLQESHAIHPLTRMISVPGGSTTSTGRARKGQAKNPFIPDFYGYDQIYANSTLYNKIGIVQLETFLVGEGVDVETRFPTKGVSFFRVEKNRRTKIQRGFAVVDLVKKVHQRVIDRKRAGLPVGPNMEPDLGVEVSDDDGVYRIETAVKARNMTAERIHKVGPRTSICQDLERHHSWRDRDETKIKEETNCAIRDIHTKYLQGAAQFGDELIYFDLDKFPEVGTAPAFPVPEEVISVPDGPLSMIKDD